VTLLVLGPVGLKQRARSMQGPVFLRQWYVGKPVNISGSLKFHAR